MLRPATPADHVHYARLFPDLATGDPVLPPDRWLDTIAPGTLIAEDGHGSVIGYAYLQILQGNCYVRHVAIEPDRRGQGRGRMLMDAIAARLRAVDCTRWCLNVKPENEAAVRLYRAIGMTNRHTMTAFRLDWDLAARLPCGDRSVIASLVAPADDAAIEAAFAMPAGQIAEARKRPDLVLLRLVDPAGPDDAGLGFAVYDPLFPGAFPFRVAAATLAPPLLAAIRAHERPDTPYIQLVSEDADLTAALLAIGATVRLSAWHMAGDVPGPAPSRHPPSAPDRC